MARFKVGVHLRPQHCDIQTLRGAWGAADELGVDVITTWDHFFPRGGDADGGHFECWSLLAAMACETKRARFGSLVSCVQYRNANLLADMARTVDHLSGGRLNLGLGAGNTERDFEEYGFDWGTPGSRLRRLESAVQTVKARLPKLNPPPMGPLPILIGASGPKAMRLVARYADMWNTVAPPEEFARKNALLNEYCAEVDRDPASIERTTNIPANAVERCDEWIGAGAQLLLVQLDQPFGLQPVEQLLRLSGR